MARLEGPWQARVSFAPGGAFAYRPGEVLVAKEDSEAAERILRGLRDQEITEDEPAGLGTARSFFRNLRSRGVEVPEGVEVVEEFLKNPRQEVDEEVLEGIRVVEEFLGYLRKELDGEALEGLGVVEEFFRYLREPRVDTPLFHEEILETFVRFTGVAGTLEAIAKLNQAGVYAQVNHVLFAHNSPEPGGSGFQANPFYANPFYANPFYANPFYANPFYANPNPAADPGFQQTGRRPSSARPAIDPKTEPLSPAPDPLSKDGPVQPRIAILDTGYAQGPVRESITGDYVDVPDLDRKGYLDPVAGHGTFIAGILEQYVPGCHIEVHAVISPYGDGDEVVIGMKLDELAQSIDRPDLVNLSFGGYSSSGMRLLAETIVELHYQGTVVVASAGNDGTSLPMYPAVIPHVVAVGALDHEGAPAPFTNYGPWVRACALGVEVVSTFFTDFNGSHPSQAGDDIDDYCGWAAWSGTSFAAPRVVASLANQMRTNDVDAHTAVQQIVDGANLQRRPMLGTVVS